MNWAICKLGDTPIYIGSLLICNNIMSESWLNDASVSIPMNGSRDAVTYTHLLAASLNVEVLVTAFMLGQLVALTAGG